MVVVCVAYFHCQFCFLHIAHEVLRLTKTQLDVLLKRCATVYLKARTEPGVCTLLHTNFMDFLQFKFCRDCSWCIMRTEYW